LKGKYKQKRERKKHKERLAPSAINNQSGSTETEKQPEQALHSQAEGHMATRRRWIDKLRNLTTNEIASLGLLVTFTIAVIYYFQLRAMQATVEAMQVQTRLSVRPFVGLDEGLDAIEVTPLQIDEAGNASLNYKIKAKNYSNAPATNVWSDANLVVADDLNTVYEQQGYACTDAVIGKPDIGLVLFQGKDRVFNSLPALTKVNQKHENSLFGVWLAGCIGYRDQFGYLCRTRFIWALYDATDNGVTFYPPVHAVTISGGRFKPTASGNAIDTCQVPKYK
jgi:hypothetical protein